MTKSLPNQPSLDHIKNEAKALLKAHQSGDEVVCEILRHLDILADKTNEQVLSATIPLQEVQHALAVEYGFASWSELKKYVENAEGDAKESEMATDWNLIRKAMNATIDACEKLEALDITDTEKGDHRARWGDYEDGVSVGDFFNRFWNFPEGSERDIVRLRSRLNIGDQKTHSEFARALINTARACSEIIGLTQEELDRVDTGFEAHCGHAGQAIRGQITQIEWIYNAWMVPEVGKAIETYREKSGRE